MPLPINGHRVSLACLFIVQGIESPFRSEVGPEAHVSLVQVALQPQYKRVSRLEFQNLPFSIPPQKWEVTRSLRENSSKSTMFAPMIPGVPSTYQYHSEGAYYQQYNSAFYGITMKKGGWDCLRHYEIILSGSVPFFLNIESMPPATMTSFPKELILRAMRIRGVPSQEVVKAAIARGRLPAVDLNQFDHESYRSVFKDLMQYAKKNLLATKSTARLAPPKEGGSRILLHSGCDEVGYEQGLLVSGLVGNGHSVCMRPHGMLAPLLDNFTADTSSLYGHGFTWARTVNHSQIKCANGSWDYYILVADCNRQYPKPDMDAVRMSGKVVAVNGNDAVASKLEVPSVATEYYLREG